MGRVIRQQLGVVGDQSPEVPDRALGHQLAHRHDVRQPAGPHRLEHEQSPFGREVDQILGLGGVDRERLLD